MPSFAETLTFDSFLSEALQNSYILKASKIDKKSTEYGIKEAWSGYFPVVSGYATTERYNDLSDGTRQITAVGNEILLNNDYYQDAAAIGLNYSIYDFGIRKRNLEIAKTDNKQKETLLLKDIRDLKLDIIVLYGETLSLYKVLGVKKQILGLQNELLTINSRLRNAGELSEIEVTNSEIDVSETKSDIEELKNSLSKSLTEFSYYTNKNYDVDDVKIEDFPEYSNDSIIPVNAIESKAKQSIQPAKLSIEKSTHTKNDTDNNINIDLKNSLEATTYDLEISKKQNEYEIQKRANLPKISFDARYNLYGSDSSKYFNSFSDIEQRSVSFRVSTSFTLFDGMKNINTVQKRKMEVEKLKVQKEQELAELKKKYTQIKLDAENSVLQSEHNKRTLELVNKNLKNLERLNTNGIIAKTECNKKKIELLDKKQRLEEKKNKNHVNRYKLETLTAKNPN